jgi:hypothetical protein
MLDHQKSLLSNLSSIRHLFKKELVKSINWLKPEELTELYRWVIENYWDTHRDEISEVFVTS